MALAYFPDDIRLSFPRDELVWEMGSGRLYYLFQAWLLHGFTCEGKSFCAGDPKDTICVNNAKLFRR